MHACIITVSHVIQVKREGTWVSGIKSKVILGWTDGSKMCFQNKTVGLGYKWGVREGRRRGPCDFEVLSTHMTGKWLSVGPIW